MTKQEAKEKVINLLKQGWCKHQAMIVHNDKPTQYCLAGAISVAYSEVPLGREINDFVIDLTARAEQLTGNSSVVAFNDNAQNVDEVISLVQTC